MNIVIAEFVITNAEQKCDRRLIICQSSILYYDEQIELTYQKKTLDLLFSNSDNRKNLRKDFITLKRLKMGYIRTIEINSIIVDYTIKADIDYVALLYFLKFVLVCLFVFCIQDQCQLFNLSNKRGY